MKKRDRNVRQNKSTSAVPGGNDVWWVVVHEENIKRGQDFENGGACVGFNIEKKRDVSKGGKNKPGAKIKQKKK